MLVILFIAHRSRRLAGFDLSAGTALLLAFVVSLVATSGSLFYSEVAGFVPCTLCWYQRILMYPQVVLLGMALWREDEHLADYHIALSLLGATIAGYHYLVQIGVLGEPLCSAAGNSISCAQRYINEFGYITISMMSLTAFLLIALLMVVGKSSNKARISRSGP